MKLTVYRNRREGYSLCNLTLDGQLAGNPLVQQAVRHSRRGKGIPVFFETTSPGAVTSTIRIHLSEKPSLQQAAIYSLPDLAKLLGALEVDAKMDVPVQFLHIDTFEEEEVLVLSLT